MGQPFRIPSSKLGESIGMCIWDIGSKLICDFFVGTPTLSESALGETLFKPSSKTLGTVSDLVSSGPWCSVLFT